MATQLSEDVVGVSKQVETNLPVSQAHRISSGLLGKFCHVVLLMKVPLQHHCSACAQAGEHHFDAQVHVNYHCADGYRTR